MRGHVGRHRRDRDIAVQLGRRVTESIVEREVAEAGRDDVDADRVGPLERGDVVVFLDARLAANVFGFREQVPRAARDAVQAPRHLAREQGPGRRAVGLRAKGVFCRFVLHDGVVEHEVMLRGDRNPAERRIRRIEAGVEERDADACAIDALIGERPEM